jgi:predicted dehydrogenase
VKWGILGASRFALKRMLPSLAKCREVEVVAIASRSIDKARVAARDHGIPRVYGSYEDLLRDPEIEVVYNPLPNHLHVPWSIRAAEAGKHVLCEKPIARTAAEAAELLAARDRTGVLIQEAVMVRVHPRWLAVREMIRQGRIGELKAVHGFFSYDIDDPSNVRNQADIGGGGLLDIGFYPITIARFCFDQEPLRVIGAIERDPRLGIDRLTSAILEFPSGRAVFTCATQLVPYQEINIFGTRGRLFLEWPFNVPMDRPTRLLVDPDGSPGAAPPEALTFDTADQYTVQGDLFSRAVRRGGPVPVPLEDAVANMRVIDAIVRSAATGAWEIPGAASPAAAT